MSSGIDRSKKKIDFGIVERKDDQGSRLWKDESRFRGNWHTDSFPAMSVLDIIFFILFYIKLFIFNFMPKTLTERRVPAP
jgi:hypothetical protein